MATLTIPTFRDRRPAAVPPRVADPATAATAVLKALLPGQSQWLPSATMALAIELAAASAGAYPPVCRMTRDEAKTFERAHKHYLTSIRALSPRDLRDLCIRLGGEEG